MSGSFRGLYAIDAHIKAYWLDIHGVAKPINNGPKNQVLASLHQRTGEIVKAVDEVIKEGPSPENKDAIAGIYNNLLESLRLMKLELHAVKTQYLMDKKFQDLITLLEQDIEGAEQHLAQLVPEKEGESPEETDSIQQYLIRYAQFLGGVVIHDIAQEDLPFFGSKVNKYNAENIKENEGLCAGLVDAWGNDKPMDMRKSFAAQEKEIEKPKKGIVPKARFPSCNVREMLSQHEKFNNQFFYYRISISSEGGSHAIGVKKCNGIDEFEVYDPNYGSFRFPNKERAIDFLEYLVCVYFITAGYREVTLREIPLDSKKFFTENDIPKCNPLEKKTSTKDVIEIFKKINYILVKNIKDQNKNKYIKMLINVAKNMDSPSNKFKGYLDKIQECVESNSETASDTISILCYLLCSLGKEGNENRYNPILEKIMTFDPKDKNSQNFLDDLYKMVLDVFYPGESLDKFNALDDVEKNFILRIFLSREGKNYDNAEAKKYDLDKLIQLVLKYRGHSDVIAGINDFEFYSSMTGFSDNNNIKLVDYISAVTFNEPKALVENVVLIESMIEVLKNSGKADEVLNNQNYYNGNYFKAMVDVFNCPGIEKTRKAIFDETPKAVEYNNTLKHIQGLFFSFSAFDVDEFVKNIDVIINGPLCNDSSKKEWGFLKDLGKMIVENKSDEDIGSYIIKNMKTCLSSPDVFDRMRKVLSSNNRMDSVLKSVMNVISGDFSKEDNCKFMFMASKNMHLYWRSHQLSPEVIYNQLTDQNQKYLLPILLNADVVKRMTPDQFSEMLDKLIKLDPNYKKFSELKTGDKPDMILSFFNDAVLRKDFINQLSADQVIKLYEFLIKPQENGHSVAECLQYPERASWIEQKTGSSSQFAGRVAPREMRWPQVVIDLRKCLNNSPIQRSPVTDSLFSDKYPDKLESKATLTVNRK